MARRCGAVERSATLPNGRGTVPRRPHGDGTTRRRTNYAAHSRPPSPRSLRDEELTEHIRHIHADNYGVYGARKIHAALVREGVDVARCTVERLMRADGLRGVIRAKSPRTTRPAPDTGRPADLVERQFHATAPDQLWVADITYIRTFSGWVYAAFVINAFSRWSSAGSSPPASTPTSPSTPWRWRSAGGTPAPTSHTTPTAASSTGLCATPNASNRRRLWPRSAPRATHTTMPSSRRSTACSRPS
ncbi:hypothetical protein B1H20_09135 [Streptomyces violaceoruber]|uniref:HTH-like domain-containing protein n=1 Tax=Streptomyces violaceoruber TaxID=1935 RepID=A0A1V0U8I8_STRVN|nr:hypothetical protein B1H20_09135 [Streptomyces violaceoruber]NEC41924.1 IS3 family transposase [Streptomyces sp. SID8016]